MSDEKRAQVQRELREAYRNHSVQWAAYLEVNEAPR